MSFLFVFCFSKGFTLFRNMLNELRQRLEDRKCPSFWIPKIDLFSDIFDDLSEEESTQINSKIKLVNDVIANPKKFIADEYLEMVRFYRQRCCYFGDHAYDEDIESAPLINKVRKSPCFLLDCSYSDRNFSRNYDPVGLEVY